MFESALVPISTGARIANRIGKMEVGTARSWFVKKWLLPKKTEDAPARGQGAAALISARRVLQMAIAARLVEMGMHPEAACKAAWHFSDRSNSTQESPGYERSAGELYAGDNVWTVLCAYPDGTNEVVRADPKMPLERVFFPKGSASRVSSRKDGAYVLLLNPIVADVAQQFAKLHRGEVI